MPLAYEEEIEEALGINDPYDSAAIGLALDAAEAMIQQYANRSFIPTDAPVTRSFPVSHGVAAVDDIATEVGLVVSADGEVSTTATLLPRNAIAQGRPVTRIEGLGRAELVDVTALFGWAEVPAPIRQATLLQTLRLVQRRHAPFGIAGSPEMGSEMRLLARLDPDVEALVRPYVRGWYVA